MSKSQKRASASVKPASKGEPAHAMTPLRIPSTEAQNEFGRVLDQAAAGQDMAITRHNVVRAVLVSAARYRQLVGRDESDLDDLAARFDELYASMQTADVREATARSMHVSPEEMGRSAVAAARRARGSRG